MLPPSHAIVLAVGPQGADAALRYAVAEATRGHRPLHLLHVLDVPAGPSYASLYGASRPAAWKVLDATAARARRLAEDAEVSADLVDHGTTVSGLVEGSRGADLLVLEHRHLGLVRRLVTGAITAGVAARASAPVVSVPEGWSARTSREPLVTVAVQDPASARHELQVAFAQARARSASLTVLHAWWIASGYDTVLVDYDIADEWAARARAELAPLLAPLRRRYPDVEVTVTVRHRPPAEAILEAAEVSDLVVIARRHHLLPLGTHLGSVARTVLHHSTAPVLVTAEQTSREDRLANMSWPVSDTSTHVVASQHR